MSFESRIKKIENDIQKLKIINIIFIIIALILNSYALFFVDTILITNKLSYLSTIIALFFGIVYAFKNYKKEAVKTFNIFINLCIITAVFQLMGEIYSCIQNYQGVRTTIISGFTIVIEIILLTIIECVKNMEKKAALSLGCSILGFAVFSILRSLALVSDPHLLEIYLIISFSCFVLSCVICLFIIAKYSDKDLRKEQNEIE